MKRSLYVLLIALMFSFYLAGSVGAQEETPVPDSSSAIQNKVQELEKMKQEDPENFKKEVSERKRKLHKKMKDLKEKDPKKFEELKKKTMERRREKLERMRRENPEKYKQEMEEKRKKLQEMKEKNPERYEKFIKKHPRIAKSLNGETTLGSQDTHAATS